MDTPYPRDLRGYGRTPPDPRWPGNAAIAVQFVLNYEEGGENCILHGDAASEAFLSEISGAVPWPGQRHMNVESVYEYGARVGFWRVWRLFTERQIPLTVYGVAMALARGPEQVAAMLEARWEIASHALRWIDYRDFTREAEAAHMRDAIRIHTQATGSRPLGWYTGRCSAHTLDLVMEEGGFVYSADSYADELPYWVKAPRGHQLIVPYTLDANDMRFGAAPGFDNGEEFFGYLKDSFDLLHAEASRVPRRCCRWGCIASGRPAGAGGGAGAVPGLRGRLRSRVAGDSAGDRAALAGGPSGGMSRGRLFRIGAIAVARATG